MIKKDAKDPGTFCSQESFSSQENSILIKDNKALIWLKNYKKIIMEKLRK